MKNWKAIKIVFLNFPPFLQIAKVVSKRFKFRIICILLEVRNLTNSGKPRIFLIIDANKNSKNTTVKVQIFTKIFLGEGKISQKTKVFFFLEICIFKKRKLLETKVEDHIRKNRHFILNVDVFC